MYIQCECVGQHMYIPAQGAQMHEHMCSMHAHTCTHIYCTHVIAMFPKSRVPTCRALETPDDTCHAGSETLGIPIPGKASGKDLL